MKWLPRERQVPFFAVIGVGIVLVVVTYFLLIQAQYESLARLTAGKDVATKQLQDYAATIKSADANIQQLTDLTKQLSVAETDMASGDLVFWTYDTVRRLKQQYKIETTDVGRPAVSDVDILATFPYKQLKFSVSGIAFYHDLGKFVADFENQFPHARIINLVMDAPADPHLEKLSFSVQIVVLIKNQP